MTIEFGVNFNCNFHVHISQNSFIINIHFGIISLLVLLTQGIFSMKLRCFVCANGHVWTIDHNGETNFPAEIKIEGRNVLVLGAKDDLGPGRAVEEEYQLWDSLTELAIAIEQSPKPSDDGSISLDQAVASAHQQVESFRKWWTGCHAKLPDQYPMVLPEDNAGLWDEQINDHSISAPVVSVDPA